MHNLNQVLICYRITRSRIFLLALFLLAAANSEANPLIDAGCVSCHNIAPPADATDITDWNDKKAPDLHYAGVKYRETWLKHWLLKPTPIRPAGFHPERHVTRSTEGDLVDATSLPTHPTVPADQLEPIVSALMKLNWGKELLPETVRQVAVPKMLAQLNFIKFKGCGSCHRSDVSYGGVSGPELYTAWNRLQPQFIWSYIEDPQRWEPMAPMPGYSLSEQEVGKLVEYLKILGKEHGNEN